MGRELKRVPLDFEWEIGKLWEGFVNPHEFQECKECNGSGYSKEYDRLSDAWFGRDKPPIYEQNPYNNEARYNTIAWQHNLTQDDVNALIKEGRLRNFKDKPTAKEVNEWSLKGFGHDAINRMIVISARLHKEGKSEECNNCSGTGEKWVNDYEKTLYENWESYEPPTGEGFQLWNTTTEGHPITPVFQTLELLCDYLAKNKISIFADVTLSSEEWRLKLNSKLISVQINGNTFI